MTGYLRWIDVPAYKAERQAAARRAEKGIQKDTDYTGFVDRYGGLFEDFTASKVNGLVVYLAHRALVGIVIGANAGTDLAAARRQVLGLMALFLAFAVYLIKVKPFLVPIANWLEASVAIMQMMCVMLNLWLLAEDHTVLGIEMSPAGAAGGMQWLMIAAMTLLLLRFVAVMMPTCPS